MLDNDFTSSYSQFGQTTFGPFLLGFTRWLRSKIADIAPDKVFFLSRDGYLMQQAYEVLDERKTLGIPHEYVYFSRRSLRAPLLWTKTEFSESFEFFSWQRFVSVSEVLAYWGIEDLQDCIGSEMEVDCAEKVMTFESMPQSDILRKIFESHKEEIFARSHAQYDALRAYFNQIGMHGRVVIVDIGWHGSMQLCLERMLEVCGIATEVTGLYVGIEQDKPLKGRTFGYVYEGTAHANRAKILCFFGCVEKLFQSYEGSTASYLTQSDGKVVPNLAPYEYPAGDLVVVNISKMQEGAMDFVREQSDFSGDCLKQMFRVAMRPSLDETAMFSGFYNIDYGAKSFFLPQKSVFRFSPKEFVLALSLSPWKTGFLKQAFKLPLPYYTIYKLLKK